MTIPEINSDASSQFVGAVNRALCDAVGSLVNGTVLVGLSGGPDSVALLSALVRLRADHAFTLHAVHVNHGLRGGESEGDEKFCRELCARWEVELGVAHLDGSTTDENGLRELRYKAFSEYANLNGLRVIVTGHNLNDQVETVLFRLFRGSSLSGLRGISVKRLLRDCDEKLLLVRPLLKVTRDSIIQYLSENRIPFRLDLTNESDQYTRNFIRNNILPVVGERFPAAVERIEALRSLVETEETFWQELVARELAHLRELAESSCPSTPDAEVWSTPRFNSQHLALRRRLVADKLARSSIETNASLVDRIIALALCPDTVLSLSEQCELRASAECLIWQARMQKADACLSGNVTANVMLPGFTDLPEFGVRLAVELFDPKDEVTFPPANSFEILVNIPPDGQPLFWRQRRQGDVIQPFGMSQIVRLKKFLHTHKGQGRGRNALVGPNLDAVVLADEREVLWVPGVGMSEKLRVVGKPTHRVRFELLRDR